MIETYECPFVSLSPVRVHVRGPYRVTVRVRPAAPTFLQMSLFARMIQERRTVGRQISPFLKLASRRRRPRRPRPSARPIYRDRCRRSASAFARSTALISNACLLRERRFPVRCGPASASASASEARSRRIRLSSSTCAHIFMRHQSLYESLSLQDRESVVHFSVDLNTQRFANEATLFASFRPD